MIVTAAATEAIVAAAAIVVAAVASVVVVVVVALVVVVAAAFDYPHQFSLPVLVVVRVSVPGDVVVGVWPHEEAGDGLPPLGGDVGGAVAGFAQGGAVDHRGR